MIYYTHKCHKIIPYHQHPCGFGQKYRVDMMRIVGFMTHSYYYRAQMAETTAWNRNTQILPKGWAHYPLAMRPSEICYFSKKKQIAFPQVKRHAKLHCHMHNMQLWTIIRGLQELHLFSLLLSLLPLLPLSSFLPYIVIITIEYQKVHDTERKCDSCSMKTSVFLQMEKGKYQLRLYCGWKFHIFVTSARGFCMQADISMNFRCQSERRGQLKMHDQYIYNFLV